MMHHLHHERVYLDTNIFIAAMEAFNQTALELFRLAEKGLIYLTTSEVTRGELLVKPIMANDNALCSRYNALFDNPDGLTVLPADGEVIKAAALLCAQAGLELLDAVHCATATLAECAFIISEDRDLQTYSPVDVLCLNDLEALK